MPLAGVRRRAVLPRPIRTLVRKLPRVPSSAVVAAVLNLMVRRRLPVRVFEHLGDRPFSIEVRDADLVMAFRYSGRRFVPVPAAGEVARVRLVLEAEVDVVGAVVHGRLERRGRAGGADELHRPGRRLGKGNRVHGRCSGVREGNP